MTADRVARPRDVSRSRLDWLRFPSPVEGLGRGKRPRHSTRHPAPAVQGMACGLLLLARLLALALVVVLALVSFAPRWLTYFTHWPWFLKDGFLSCFQPPFLHCRLVDRATAEDAELPWLFRAAGMQDRNASLIPSSRRPSSRSATTTAAKQRSGSPPASSCSSQAPRTGDRSSAGAGSARRPSRSTQGSSTSCGRSGGSATTDQFCQHVAGSTVAHVAFRTFADAERFVSSSGHAPRAVLGIAAVVWPPPETGNSGLKRDPQAHGAYPGAYFGARKRRLAGVFDPSPRRSQ